MWIQVDKLHQKFLTHILWCYTSSFENIKRIWYLLWEGGVYFAIRVNNNNVELKYTQSSKNAIIGMWKVRYAILYFSMFKYNLSIPV